MLVFKPSSAEPQPHHHHHDVWATNRLSWDAYTVQPLANSAVAEISPSDWDRSTWATESMPGWAVPSPWKTSVQDMSGSPSTISPSAWSYTAGSRSASDSADTADATLGRRISRAAAR